MNTQTHKLIQNFSINKRGRDFVTGDIHGCFDQLSDALDFYDFDPTVDRCFTVGDLVDRGPYSTQVLEWLAHPWFHACLGNHEETFLKTDPDSEQGSRWFSAYGGQWWLDMPAEDRAPYFEAFARLPIIIEVATAQGTVGIVHADVPKGMAWDVFKNFISCGDRDVLQEALWGRRRVKSLIPYSVKGIERVVCGHTITPSGKIKTVGNVWFIDTGAFLKEDPPGLTVLPMEALFKKPPR